MPYHKKIYQFGNLFIHFKIKFPNELNKGSMDLLGQALSEQKGKKEKVKGKPVKKQSGAAEEAKDSEKVDEEVYLQTFKEHHRNTHHGGGERGNDSEEEDEDGHPHGQRIGCQS